MAALLGIALIGSAALAVDVSVWEGNIGTMQGAADQAALAAGLAMSAGKVAARNEAKSVAAAHGFVDQMDNIAVTVNIPPASGSYTLNANAIEVVITQPQTRFLSGVSLASPLVADVKGVAVPTAAPTCLLMLAQTETGINGGGNGGVNTQNCNIYVNSQSSCAVSTIQNSSITGYDVFLGATSKNGCSQFPSPGVNATHELKLGVDPALDPYGSRPIPKPSTPCKPASTSNSRLDPGTYCGLKLNGNQSLTLNSGVYIFDGGGLDLSQNAQLKGTNVTLVFTSSGTSYGNVSVGGNAQVTLSPMTSGDTAGMAIWLDGAGKQPLTINQNTYFNITGAVYAPQSRVTWSGNASSPCTQLIAYSSTFNQNAIATFKHDCSGLGVADVASAAGYKLLE